MEYGQTPGGVLVPQSAVDVGGRFTLDHYRNGELLDSSECKNLVVNEGLNHLLSTTFNGGTQIGTWYLGLFEGNYTPIATVNAATIVAASTECVAYDETTRPEYDEAAAAAQSVTNTANKATFTFNATKTIYGAFLASNSAKSATTGVLMAAARFSAPKNVVDDDQLLLTYVFSASSV